MFRFSFFSKKYEVFETNLVLNIVSYPFFRMGNHQITLSALS